MIPPDLKCMGFKDMNQQQLDALIRVIQHAVALSRETFDQDIFEMVLEDIDEMVLAFGGNGIRIATHVSFED